jgi:CDP-diacylglycerol pyrophosphatase
MFQIRFVEIIIIIIIIIIKGIYVQQHFSENRAACEIMSKKCCRAGRATDDNIPHALCMMDT